MSNIGVVRLLLALCVLFLGNSVQAQETCTGECKILQNFDNLTNCLVDGRSAQCWADNGFPASALTDAVNWTVKSGPKALTGTGYLEGEALVDSSGPGFWNDPIPGAAAGYTACSQVFYLQYGDGYVGYSTGPHGPGITVAGTQRGGCGMGGTVELDQANLYLYRAAQGRKCCSSGLGTALGDQSSNAAGGDECNIYLPSNSTPRPFLQNGKWIKFEERYVVDNSCTYAPKNAPDQDDCNGQYHLLIDDTPYISRTNVNMGGFEFGATLQVRRHQTYFHRRWPWWRPKMFLDRIRVHCNTGYTPIVVPDPPSLNAIGTPDPNSPYYLQFSQAEHKGGGLNSDCNGAGRMNISDSSWWRPTPSDTAILPNLPGYPYPEISRTTDGFGKNVYDGPCQAGNLNGSMRVHLTNGSGDGGGISYSSWTPTTTFTPANKFLEGYVYIPSGQDYSNLPVLMGWANYGCYSGAVPYTRTCGGSYAGCDQAAWGNYIGAAIVDSSGPKWGVAERERGGSNPNASASFISTKPVEFDRWVEYRLQIGTGNLYSLWIDGENLVKDRPFQRPTTVPTGPGNYNFGSLNTSVTGVLDWCGTGTFLAYFDVNSDSTVSTRDCDGWTAGRCPFSSTSPTTTSAFENLLSRRGDRCLFRRN